MRKDLQIPWGGQFVQTVPKLFVQIVLLGWFKSVPLPTIQSREPHLNLPGSYELSWPFPVKQGPEVESSYELGGSDVVRELLA